MSIHQKDFTYKNQRCWHADSGSKTGSCQIFFYKKVVTCANVIEVMSSNDRDDFLITMYGKMWDNIDRHILVVWQSVGVLAGAFAALVLTEKGTLPIDYSATLVLLVSAWQIAHVVDASWWFNRNLLIVTNIERQFLTVEDSRQIHCYFVKHRKPKILDHYQIQIFFGCAVAVLILIYHFAKQIYPNLAVDKSILDRAIMSLPYVVFISLAIGLYCFYRRQRIRHLKLQKASPGKNLSPPESS